MAIVEDRFANKDLSQTYNSRSESETSDLSDIEDELEKTKTTSALSDGSDLINTTSFTSSVSLLLFPCNNDKYKV